MRFVSVAVLAMVLSACGGGGGSTSSSSPSGSTGASPAPVASGGAAEGQITGFGSVIIDGVRYEDSQAKAIVDNDPDAPRSITTARLKLGMRVAVKHDGASAAEVSVESNLKGPVTSVALAQSSMVVLGTTVKIVTLGAAATLFDGYGSLEDIKEGETVEIHAIEAADASLQATRIERASATDGAAIKLAGRVTGFDSAAKTFKLGATTIDFANAALRPANAVLTNDQRVVVYSNTAPAASRLVAAKLRIKDHRSAQAGKLTVGGAVTSFQSVKSFVIAGVKIDASAAKFEHGMAADLANGTHIKVEGITDGDVLIAREVEFKKGAAASAKTELTGPIMDFIDAGTFKVRGQLVSAADAATKFENGSASDLIAGAVVKVEGSIERGKLVAKEVKFVGGQDRDGDQASYKGVIANYDMTAQTFVLAGRPMKLLATTRFEDGSPAMLRNGQFVEVEGGFKAGVFEVSEVEFKPSPVHVVHLDGVAYDVKAGSFRVSDVLVAIDQTTEFSGPSNQLQNGVRVKVRIIVPRGAAAQTLVASRVEFRQAEFRSDSELRGVITDFASKAQFRVAGQLVDASAAVFRGDVEAALRNGREVEVEGLIADGMLKAKKVEFEG